MLKRKAVSFRAISILTLVVCSLALAVPAIANNTSDIRSTQGFRKHVTLEGVRAHQAALQAIADANGGTRLSGTKGYNDSKDYVVSKMTAAGYNVTVQAFNFELNSDATPPTLQQVSPTPKIYVNGVEYGSLQYSGSGDFTAPLVAVDLAPAATPGASTSGCEAADFAGFPAGTIALMLRGTCDFRVKVLNAQAAGAVGAILYNDGFPTRTGIPNVTLQAPSMTLPVVGTTTALGLELANGKLNGPTGITARLRVDRIIASLPTYNVFAETPGGDPNRVIVVGAHLDSVARGPGINDNGSGTAGILEVAEVFAEQERTPRNKLRFAWWGAEEHGLVGSNYYVNNLPQAELDKIELNLNFDMIGSPNFVRFVYDGDNSAFPVGPGAEKGPAGSGAIENVFHSFFASQNLASAETPFSGRSDYRAFILKGIPAGGLFTGAEGLKTAAEAAIYGGTAGQPYDPCYHLACDTYANNSNEALDQMSDAVAHSVLYFSKHNFDKTPLASLPVSSGQGSGGEGGGLHDDHDHDLETR